MQRGKAGVPTQGDLVVTECHCSERWGRVLGTHHETLEHVLSSDSKTGREGDFCAVQHGGGSLSPLARQGDHGHLVSARLLQKRE